MSFLGVSYLEIFTVLLVALVFLGPDKMIEAGKKLGKTLKEFRKIASELPSLEDIQQPDTLTKEFNDHESKSENSENSHPNNDSTNNLPEPDGPVAFRRTQEQSQPFENGNIEDDSNAESNLDR